MKHIIVGTAGHIDHGKTALIKALTGTDADRLKEEQQRGITIDIGFASLTLPNDIELGIIDVPGHEKFVKNMLAGVGGLDMAILVIAADEGIMPQTEEHLAICDLLHIQRGLVALTKTDLVEEEWLEMVVEDIRDGLQGTFVQDAPIIPVSSKTRAGIDELLQALETLAGQVQERRHDEIFRLPIDRVFTIKGFGTVITGTLISGSVQTEEMIEILPEQVKTRVRNIQVHDLAVKQAYAGQRTALNLHGLEKRSIERGMVLCSPDLLSPTFMIDAHLVMTPKAQKALKNRARVRFHHGTSEIMARVVLFDREELLPGDSAFVQIRLEAPLIAMARDRFIIRSYSPIMTIGGGEILYIHPKKHKRSSPIQERMRALKEGSLEDVLTIYVEDAGLLPVTSRALSGVLAAHEDEIEAGLRQLIQQGTVINTERQGLAVIHANRYQSLVAQIIQILDTFHSESPLKLGMAKEELRKKLPEELSLQIFQQALDEQMAEGTLIVQQKLVRKSEHQLQLTATQQGIKEQIENVYRSAHFQPPNVSDMAQEIGGNAKVFQEILGLLVDEGTLQRVEGGIYYHRDALQEVRRKVVDYLGQHHEIGISEAKTLFNISRKYLVPILTYLDAEGVTMRTGDVRILRQNI